MTCEVCGKPAMKNQSRKKETPPSQAEKKCPHCKGDLSVRNPSGFCDHLQYPEFCEICFKASIIKAIKRNEKKSLTPPKKPTIREIEKWAYEELEPYFQGEYGTMDSMLEMFVTQLTEKIALLSPQTGGCDCCQCYCEKCAKECWHSPCKVHKPKHGKQDWEKQFDGLELRTMRSEPPRTIVVDRKQAKAFIAHSIQIAVEEERKRNRKKLQNIRKLFFVFQNKPIPPDVTQHWLTKITKYLDKLNIPPKTHD